MHHFMTNSPWSAQSVLMAIRQEIAQVPEFAQGSMLLLDESADEKASADSVGCGRQHNGRLGKIEMSQVGTFLGLVHGEIWTWVDGELFLPEKWFEASMKEKRKQLGVPEDRCFATKVELGWQMIERVRQDGLPFEAIGCDTLYGRSVWLRRKINTAGLIYMADVPADTEVYLNKPTVGVPDSKPGRKPYTRARVLSEEKPVKVRDLINRIQWHKVRVRATERGNLCDEFAQRRVWTTHNGEEPVAETLLIRRDDEGKYHYALTNAPIKTPLEKLAWMKCQRHFIERSNQDAKSELGWDELRAQKYRAWEHHLALTIMATWFIAQTKHDWAKQYQRDPRLKSYFKVEVLPTLSMANIRELLRSVMPLPRLTPEQATDLVVEHLVNRTRSRKSRLKHSGHQKSPS